MGEIVFINSFGTQKKHPETHEGDFPSDHEECAAIRLIVSLCCARVAQRLTLQSGHAPTSRLLEVLRTADAVIVIFIDVFHSEVVN